MNLRWARWPVWLDRRSRPRTEAVPLPLRSELFSVDQLTRHARALALSHRVVSHSGFNRLLNRLGQNEKILRAFNRETFHSHSRRLTPAAEWLLDNFYLIEEQIQLTRRHLPRDYSRELPRIRDGHSAGFPRVYDIVLELISHVDGQIDAEPLRAFVAAYQTGASLKLGELWAIPIMLRLGLIENLQRVTTRLIVAREDCDLAELWVDRLQHMAQQDPSCLVVVVADMAKAGLSLSSTFVAAFCQRLSRQNPVLQLARSWLEQKLAEQGLSIEYLVHQDTQNQAADQVSVSHSITSLRFLGAMDWETFVEGLSLVEDILRSDPAGVYERMDFQTRDRYRHAVESLARYSALPEAAVAQRAIQLAAESARQDGSGSRLAHVGFHLVDQGRFVLEGLVQVRWPWRVVVERGIRRFPLLCYGGGMAVLTLFAAAVVMQQLPRAGMPAWQFIAVVMVILLCASQLALGVVNWLCTLLVKPQLLPRMDYSAGIAPECRTMVVVPTMLTTAAGADHLVETLEIHQLANRDPHLHFALLTDFRDAPQEHMPDDHALLQRVREGVERLNSSHPAPGHASFFLFHRPRRWNGAEGVWMGYERKRGKLMEFNGRLRGRSQECFSEIVGDTAVLPAIRYVITLDTDTQLPRDAARQLVGTMAHPLIHPVFDAGRGVVVEGYAILQPRVGASLPSACKSWFARLFAGEPGIDPYTREVSDVYQDVFGEGSFTGKGIYDVDAFERALKGRFPENAVLSHDLLEACHARSGLVSDVELYEPFPARYDVDSERRHRWIRGDWQVVRWLGSQVPCADAHPAANPLSVLSQWKIIDNLRRSLVPVALMLLMTGAWLLLPLAGSLGVLVVVVIITLPVLLASATSVFHKPDDLPWALHLRVIAVSGGRHLGQGFVAFALLPYDAFISLDAIGRTGWRLLVTRRRLLEWRTSGDVEAASKSRLAGFYARMWFVPVAALAIGALLAVMQPAQLGPAFPVLCIWLAGPCIAWWISQTIRSPQPDLSGEQLLFLRHTARRTWHFFETFVTAQENWLPPDNFQEIPVGTIASRTSPTNMGLALLANLAARDLGYLTAGGLIQRTHDALATMQRMERYRGHFLNWYETRTLQPLQPRYVSSVDSGNLAGHLLTLGAGLREQGDEPLFAPQCLRGLTDTASVLKSMCGENALLSQLEAELENVPATLDAARALLERIAVLANRIAASLAQAGEDPKWWSAALQAGCAEHLAELRLCAPWLWAGDGLPHTSGRDAATGIAVGRIPTLREVALLDPVRSAAGAGALVGGVMSPALHAAISHARERLQVLETLAAKCDELAVMDFAFLFDRSRDLFSIGFNVNEHRLDGGFYDLLASEARLCSYVAIALGQVPQEHWFTLGRLLVAPQSRPLLASWSGSMFEYLMPLLVMPDYEHTLLDHTSRGAVQQQIAYGRLHGVPWGISESGYNRTDVHLTYQYRAFGVPGLGVKRGLGQDLVIAPYATAMALMVDPEAACDNLQRLAAEGRAGRYGFYEAVDYTPTRVPPDEASATVFSYMAHHQGISLLSLANALHANPMQRRFMACPLLKAGQLLLQERVPRGAASVVAVDHPMQETGLLSDNAEALMRVFTHPSPPTPDVHLLSNGHYHVAITSAGGGYSRCGNLALTRWREDATRDCWGTFVYVRDLATRDFWSVGYQPTRCVTKGYQAIFTEARAEFRQRHANLEIHTEISVSPEDDVELRRITLTNRSSTARTIELTSYAEVVIAAAAADDLHPAFSNLFVRTEFVRQSSAILATRRARSPDETPPWLLHVMAGQGEGLGAASCETDRSRFVGRGGSLASPAAMQGESPLSGTVGPVLDPIVCLRRTVSLPAHATAIVHLVLGVAESRDGALAQVEKYQSTRMAERAFDLAWTHSQVTLHQLDATEREAQLYGRLAGALIYADPARRAPHGVLRNNRRGQSGLWSHGISGDVPIVVLRISDTEKIEIVRQLIQAHSYWRMKGLTVELVILNDDVSVYRQSLQDRITSLISSGIAGQMLDRPGGIFVRRLEQMPNDDRILLQAVARIVLDDEGGTLAQQVEHHGVQEPPVPMLKPSRRGGTDQVSPLPDRELIFCNGHGGFTRDGHEYVITLQPGQMTPAPWVNVLANPHFGTVVSESGAAYSWIENAHEFRLTPWNNDSVRDGTGEALYIRDEHTGQFWSPTPLPARGETAYVIRHGFGYTVFEHAENGIHSELWVYVAMDAPVKFSVLKLRNVSGRPRRLSVTGYWEWVLGDLRQKNLLHVQTEVDIRTGALLARNGYNTEFADRIVFVDVNDKARTLTGDRREFLGRNGSLTQPAALKRARLSGKVGAGLDPCGAVQVSIDLPDGQERETSFRLGVGRNLADVRNLIQRFRHADAAQGALNAVWSYWNRTLGAVNVDTPDAAVNVMANGWLVYQTLSCRLWGRAGFYQSGGAYGFRDQLQDVMALVHAEPALAREHLLRAAAHQFREGDVQHWWHPPAGRGVRTHFSDDYLWLPYATCRYVECVADTGVLDESIYFLEGRALRQDEEAYYDLPGRSEETGTLYQHCVRAIEYGLKFGVHGLPLMGCGDWNDGMNLVGRDGRGESVWLAFFLYDVLIKFGELARSRQDAVFADRCVTEAGRLRQNIEQHAWDGQWYRRAYFDSGEPLGSRSNAECQIDSLPQSWSVISGAADRERSRVALAAVDERLVRRAAGLVQLFDPPFDTSALNPGYIKGYIPGVRENGGQYTHAAIWTAMALAMMGETEHAWELFRLLNPVHHGATPEAIATYKVEPYVVAADVYAVAPHTGRGGWTWYTGSAAWMYRLLVETLLGVNIEGDRLRLIPRMPKAWNTYRIHYRYRQTVYHIRITRTAVESAGADRLFMDGRELGDLTLPLVDDRREHTVEMMVR